MEGQSIVAQLPGRTRPLPPIANASSLVVGYHLSCTSLDSDTDTLDAALQTHLQDEIDRQCIDEIERDLSLDFGDVRKRRREDDHQYSATSADSTDSFPDESFSSSQRRVVSR